jgi:hypothetical protein
MSECYPKGPVRVLYSFPHKIGADRICMIAWHQVEGVAPADAYVLVYTGVVRRPLDDSVRVQTTLARGRFRVPIESWAVGEASGSMTESSLARFPSSPVMSMLSTSGPSALSRRSEPLPASAFRRSSSVRTRTHGSRTRSSPPNVSGSGPCYHTTNTPATRRSSATRSRRNTNSRLSPLPVRLRREDVPRRGLSAREAPMPYARATYRSAFALGILLRAVAPGHARHEQRQAARAALRVLAGLCAPRFGAPPAQALVPLDAAELK